MTPARGRCLCGGIQFLAKLPSKWVAHGIGTMDCLESSVVDRLISNRYLSSGHVALRRIHLGPSNLIKLQLSSTSIARLQT